MLFGIVLFIYVIVCIFLCLLVLVQSDKGGGISSTLGGGFASANTLLGAQDTANILTRGTTIFASAFMILCIILSLVLGHGAAGKVDRSALKARAEKMVNYAPSSILDEGSSLPLSSGEGEATAPQAGEALPQGDAPLQLPLDGGAAPAGK